MVIRSRAIHMAAIILGVCLIAVPAIAQTSFAALGVEGHGRTGRLPARRHDCRASPGHQHHALGHHRRAVASFTCRTCRPAATSSRSSCRDLRTAKREVVLRVGQDATLDIGLKVAGVAGDRPRERRERAGRNTGDGRQPDRPQGDRQPADAQPRLRRARQAGAGRDLHRTELDGLFRLGPAPVPEQRVRRRRDQRDAVLRHAGRVVSAGLDPGIPGDDQRLLRRVRTGVRRGAERHHQERQPTRCRGEATASCATTTSTRRRTRAVSSTASRSSSASRRSSTSCGSAAISAVRSSRDSLFFFVGYENFENDATTVLAISDYWRNRGLAIGDSVEEHHPGVHR